MANENNLQENKIVRFLTRVFDLIVLNVLCVLTSLPIITAGASVTALYSVMLKLVVREEGYIVRDYFEAFRKHFKVATIEFVIAAAVEALLLADWLIAARMGSFSTVMRTLIGAVQIIWLLEVLFLFPVTAVSENGVVRNLKDALRVPVSSLPQAFVVVLVTLSAVLVTLLNQTTIMYGAVFWTCIGVALIAFVNARPLRAILRPFYQL